MGFEVIITDEAFSDLDSLTGLIKQQASVATARKWFGSIFRAIESLGEMPARCSLASEAGELGEGVRVLLHGPKNRAYKIYFIISASDGPGGSVHVLHVRHWARKPLNYEELGEAIGEEGYYQDEE